VAKSLAKPWVCVFRSLSGGHARALFATKEEAKQFAEQHARAFPTSIPLTWEDSDDSSVLILQVGHYLIAPVSEHDLPSG
jgi:hypothetical protein